MSRYAVTGTAAVEFTYYVEAENCKEAIEKAAAAHPVFDSKDIRELNKLLDKDLCIYPYNMQPINWLKAEDVKWHGELVQTRMLEMGDI